jgi:hypothetical protein
MVEPPWYHLTPVYRVASILERGLDPTLSVGVRPRVWLASYSKVAWVRLHLMARHPAVGHNWVLLTVHVPRYWLTRVRRGIYTCDRLIPPERIYRCADPSLNIFAPSSAI